MFKMSNETYDFLKVLCTRILPAIMTFVGIVMSALQMPYRDIVLTIGTGFIGCLGQCLGIASEKYHANNVEE